MKVLFATDGMTPALDAGRLLPAVARRDAEITVLSVAYAGIPALEHALFQLDPIPDRREAAVEIVDGAAAHLRAEGFDVRGRIAEGHPAEEILSLIHREWFDLTILGGSLRSWAGRHLLGSVSTHVLHSSPSSVLVVHEVRPTIDRARAMLAVDGSRGSYQACEWFGRWADPNRCDLTVVAVAQDPDEMLYTVPQAVLGGRDSASHARLEEKAHVGAQMLAEHAAAHLGRLGFSVETRALVGHPTGLILKEADSGQFDVVGVGARGLGPVKRVLMGSVSDAVTRHVRAAFVGRRFLE